MVAAQKLRPGDQPPLLSCGFLDSYGGSADTEREKVGVALAFLATNDCGDVTIESAIYDDCTTVVPFENGQVMQRTTKRSLLLLRTPSEIRGLVVRR